MGVGEPIIVPDVLRTIALHAPTVAGSLGLVVDVRRDYGASGSALQTTGSIAAGSDVLTIAEVGDFQDGQGIAVAGAGAGGALLVTSIASGGGSTTLVLAEAAGTSVVGAVVSHDDTAAIQGAVDAAAFVSVPHGIYRVSAAIALKNDVVFCGHGMGKTVLQASPNPGYPVLMVPSGVSGVAILLLTCDGGATAAGTRGADGVSIVNGASRVRVSDTEVTATADNGIEADGTDITVERCWVHGCWTNGIYAIGASAASPAQRVHVRDCLVEVNNLGGNWDGIDLDPNCVDCTVEDNVVIGNDIILYDPATPSGSSGNIVRNNRLIQSTENGIDLLGSQMDTEVVGNRIESPTGWGIVVNGPWTRMRIAGNYIISPTQEGIRLQNTTATAGAPAAITINDNVVINPSATSGGYAGIALANGATDILVVGNRIEDTRSPVLMLRSIDATGAGGNVTIARNVVTPGTTGPVIATAANTAGNGGWNQQAIGNPGSNPQGWATTTPALPAATGSADAVQNENAYPVRVTMKGNAGTHITDPTADVLLPADPVEITLNPGQKIYFATTVPTAWAWFGV